MRQLSTLGRRLGWIALAGTIAGCGSDSTGPKSANSTLTSQQATLVASGIFEEISLALSKSGFAGQVTPGAALSSVPFTGSTTINSPCTNGGSITGNYNYTVNTNTDGSGSIAGTFAVTMSGCKVSTGTSVIPVSGNLTYTFTEAFSQNVALDTFDWRGTGSFTWPGGTCGIDYTIHYTGASGGHITVNGTVCGVNVSETT